MAADGRDSWVRQAAGIGARNTPHGEKGVVANFRCEAPPQHRLPVVPPDGVLAYPALPDQQMSMVWSAPDALADELVALSPEALCRPWPKPADFRLGRPSGRHPWRGLPLRLMRVKAVVKPAWP